MYLYNKNKTYETKIKEFKPYGIFSILWKRKKQKNFHVHNKHREMFSVENI